MKKPPTNRRYWLRLQTCLGKYEKSPENNWDLCEGSQSRVWEGLWEDRQIISGRCENKLCGRRHLRGKFLGWTCFRLKLLYEETNQTGKSPISELSGFNLCVKLKRKKKTKKLFLTLSPNAWPLSPSKIFLHFRIFHGLFLFTLQPYAP